jgi:hypothetical protein
MEIILLNIDPSNARKYDGYSGKIYLEFIPDTREVQLWIALVHLEGGASITGRYPFSSHIGLLHVEEFGTLRVEQATFKTWLTKWAYSLT